jgi:hypothetical protein
MTYFINIKLLGDLGETKINRDKVKMVTLNKSEITDRKLVTVTYDDGSVVTFTEGLTIENAELVYKLF